jgi:hypothetical protein
MSKYKYILFEVNARFQYTIIKMFKCREHCETNHCLDKISKLFCNKTRHTIFLDVRSCQIKTRITEDNANHNVLELFCPKLTFFISWTLKIKLNVLIEIFAFYKILSESVRNFIIEQEL